MTTTLNATNVQELRERARQNSLRIREFGAKYADALPPVEAIAELDALENAQADIRDMIARVERVERVNAGAALEPSNPVTKPGSGQRRNTVGERFIQSNEFQTALREYSSGGLVSGPFKMPGVHSYGGMRDFGLRADLITGDSSTSAGAFVVPDRFSELIELGRRPLTILDIIRRLETDSDLIEYVAQTGRTNAAAPVVEAVATTGASGMKPESDIDFEVRTAPVINIAHFLAITRRAAADVPQMRGIIDNELRDGLQERMEYEVLNGIGAPGFIGITQTTGTQTQAFDTDVLITLRRARTKVRTVARRIPTAYVLNPTDWENIDLMQDAEQRYYYGGPADIGVPRLWGLPVVESEILAVGTGLVGDFRRAILWDRQLTQILVTDSHSDWFLRNILAILGELRAAFALVQPNAIVEADLTAL